MALLFLLHPADELRVGDVTIRCLGVKGDHAALEIDSPAGRRIEHFTARWREPAPADPAPAPDPTSGAGTPPAPPGSKTCYACAHSYTEPDAPYLICGHPDAGEFGLHIKAEPLEHCEGFRKFEQHPLRNTDGTLKR